VGPGLQAPEQQTLVAEPTPSCTQTPLEQSDGWLHGWPFGLVDRHMPLVAALQ
jgi:hypothetical protein